MPQKKFLAILKKNDALVSIQSDQVEAILSKRISKNNYVKGCEKQTPKETVRQYWTVEAESMLLYRFLDLTKCENYEIISSPLSCKG